MSNLLDYLQNVNQSWQKMPFNEVDALILAQAAYLAYRPLLKNHYHQFKDLKNQTALIGKAVSTTFYPEENQKLITALAQNQRFSEIQWSDFWEINDHNTQQQFSAITFKLPNNCYYLSFGGTDGTFLGIKEDLNMSFQKIVPSQRSGLKYFNRISQKYSGEFYLGGHSKGGNVAIYSLLHASLADQVRIKKVFNFDGPGFGNDEKSLSYNQIKNKVNKFVPQSSVVGRLLESRHDFMVVKSSGRGFHQHDLFTWQVENHHLVTLPETDAFSNYISQTTSEVVAEIDDENKEYYLDSLYDLFTATDIASVTDLKKNWLPNLIELLKVIKDSDPQLRKSWLTTTKDMVIISFKSTKILFKKNKYRGP